jgi:hypothetical protein
MPVSSWQPSMRGCFDVILILLNMDFPLRNKLFWAQMSYREMMRLAGNRNRGFLSPSRLTRDCANAIFILFCWRGVETTGVWSQNFTFSRQQLYHLSHTSSPMLILYYTLFEGLIFLSTLYCVTAVITNGFGESQGLRIHLCLWPGRSVGDMILSESIHPWSQYTGTSMVIAQAPVSPNGIPEILEKGSTPASIPVLLSLLLEWRQYG